MILVTGAAGLLGQHLVSALSSAGMKLKATYRETSGLPAIPQHPLVEWIACDITDIISLEKAFDNITHVYHCAAMVSYDPRMKEAMMETNIEGTANLVNLCLDHKIEKLCHVSSIATIGEGIPGNLMTEKDDWEENAKNSNYAISKQGAEMEVWRGIAEGLNAVIVNPGIILGEGDDSKSSTNLFKIVHDEFPYYTSGITSWVDVKDVVEIMIRLMNSDVNNQRFIVSAGNFSYRDIFSMMAEAMHKKPPHIEAGKRMTELVWRLSYLKSLLTGRTATITKETAQSAHAIRRFDNSKLVNELKDFHYRDIQETIRRISSSYTKNRTSAH